MTKENQRSSDAMVWLVFVSLTIVSSLVLAAAGVGAAPSSLAKTFSPAALLLVEDFSYSTGQLTDLNGGANVSGGNWVDFSGTGNPIMVTSPGLTYPGYVGTGVGNKVTITATTTSAEDAYRAFSTQTTGTVYAALMVNVIDTNLLPLNSSATGEYVTGFLPSSSTTAFASRISFRQGTAPDTFQVGLRASGNAGNTTEFSTIDRPVGTPILIVFSYTIVDGATNDITRVWINPALDGSEPPATITQVAAAELFDVSRIFIRQGASSGVSTPNADVDGIRVSTTWQEAIGASVPSATTVQFSAATYMDDESQSAEITVTRTGDTTGASSVNFSTVSTGSALGGAACTADTDYINTNQVVNFAAGETSQTINVPLCADVRVEPVETLVVALVGPSGGTDLGTPDEAVLSINDTASQFVFPTPISVTSGSPANVYPSSITLNGAAPTNVFRIRVTLYDFLPTPGNHVDVLLVGPNGAKYVLMGHVGSPVPQTSPVTLTFSDAATNVLPFPDPLTTGTFRPTNCDFVQDFPAPAPPGPYIDPGCDLDRTTAETLFGTFSGQDGNGTWSLYVRDEEEGSTTVVGTILGGWGLELLPVTAADAVVSGRVLTPDGRGLRNAVVSMFDSNGVRRTVLTSSLGFYQFDNVETGESYVVGISSKRYRFQSRVVEVLDSLTDVDFVGIE